MCVVIWTLRRTQTDHSWSFSEEHVSLSKSFLSYPFLFTFGTLHFNDLMSRDLSLQQNIWAVHARIFWLNKKTELGNACVIGIHFVYPLVSFTEQFQWPCLVLVDSGCVAFGAQGPAGHSRHGLLERASACHPTDTSHHHT